MSFKPNLHYKFVSELIEEEKQENAIVRSVVGIAITRYTITTNNI